MLDTVLGRMFMPLTAQHPTLAPLAPCLYLEEGPLLPPDARSPWTTLSCVPCHPAPHSWAQPYCSALYHTGVEQCQDCTMALVGLDLCLSKREPSALGDHWLPSSLGEPTTHCTCHAIQTYRGISRVLAACPKGLPLGAPTPRSPILRHHKNNFLHSSHRLEGFYCWWAGCVVEGLNFLGRDRGREEGTCVM